MHNKNENKLKGLLRAYRNSNELIWDDDGVDDDDN